MPTDPPPLAAAIRHAVLLAQTAGSGGTDSGDFPVLGICLEFISLACGISGKQLLRLGHLEGQKLVRLVGLLLQSFVGPVLDAFALSCAAQSILVLFGGLDAVGTVLVAPWLLGEKRTWRKIAGACLVGLGTALAAGFGPRGSEADRSYGLDELSGLFLRPAVLVWAVVFTLLVIWCLRQIRSGSHASSSRSSPIRGLAFGMLAGMFAGNTWCLKTVMRLLVVEHSIAIAASPWAWMSVFGAAASAVAAMWFLVKGTDEFPTLFLVPVLGGSKIVSGAASGLLVMHEGRGLPPWRLLGYGLGVLAVLAGIQVLYSDEAAQPCDSEAAAAQELVAPRRQDVPLQFDGRSIGQGAVAKVQQAMSKFVLCKICGNHVGHGGKGYCSGCLEDPQTCDSPFSCSTTGSIRKSPNRFSSCSSFSSIGGMSTVETESEQELLGYHSFRRDSVA